MRLSTPQGHGFFHEHGFFLGHDLHDETGIHRGWLASIGVIYVILGVIGLGWLSLMTVASVLFFGALALAGGIVQLLQSFTSRGWRNVSTGALLGALYIFAALVIFNNPLASSLILTLFLAGALIALGIVRIAFSLQHKRNRYWTWSVLSGALSLIIGFLIMIQWPVTGLLMIGLFVSLEMIFHGAAAIGLAIEHDRTV
jgi:uncharacterized membrane protein HdeD (DUF308 family)